MAGNPSASWEEIVDRVSVKSNYFNVQDAANGWREIFQYLGELEGNLRKLKKNSESWTGGAADGFRARLDDYIKDIDTLQQSHERIVTGLEACAGHLKDAVDVIPIPSWMMTKLEDAQASYQMGDEVPGYAPGSFGHFYLKHVMGDAYSKIPLVGSAWKKLESWLIDNEKIAKQAYADLQSDYGGETSSIPTGQPISPQLSTDSPEFDPTDFNAGGLGGPGSGGMPSVDPSLDPGGLNAGGPGLDPGTVSMSDPAGDPLAFDPPGGTGLAGAGGGLAAPGGVGGLGAGGLSSPGGLGGGLSGPGGLGAGSGLGAAGPRGGGLGGMPLGAMPLGGAGAGRGGGGRSGGQGRLPALGAGVTPPPGILGNRADTSGRGAGSRGAGAGVLPPGRGGGIDDEQNQDSWLQEDEDPWGTDDDVPPALLGA
jgi:hypothetical protein